MVPDINSEFEKYGSNNAGLIVLAAFSYGTDAACLQFDTENNVAFPSISGNSGGSQLFSTYRVSATPTLILIAPDRQIVEKDIWPINRLTSTLEQYDFNQTGVKGTQQLILKPLYNISGPGAVPRIYLCVTENDRYNLSLVALNGKTVANLYNGYLPCGDHIFDIKGGSPAKGTYILKLSNRGKSTSMTLILP